MSKLSLGVRNTDDDSDSEFHKYAQNQEADSHTIDQGFKKTLFEKFNLYPQELKDKLTEDQKTNIKFFKYNVAAMLLYFNMGTNLLFQLFNLSDMYALCTGKTDFKNLVALIYWLLWLNNMVLIYIRQKYDKPELIHVQITVLLIRNQLALFDFENRRVRFEQM